jgi:predicted ArsR family transcriptional regulator
VEPSRQSTVLRALAALEDPTRQQLFEFVRTSSGTVTREAAASAVGISRKLAAFHLDKLVEVGLLVAGYEATARTRQFGRPPKAYRRSDEELRISVPERHPEVLAEVLVEAVTAARGDESPISAAMRVAREAGERLGADVRQTERPGRLGPERALTLAAGILRQRGFEPVRTSDACVRLRNCPYLPMSRQATEFVCGINEQHLSGLIRGLQAPESVEAVLAPRPGECCVELRTNASG